MTLDSYHLLLFVLVEGAEKVDNLLLYCLSFQILLYQFFDYGCDVWLLVNFCLNDEVVISLTVPKLGHFLKLTILVLRLGQPRGLTVIKNQVIVLDSPGPMLRQERVTGELDVNLFTTIINSDKFIL